LDNVETSYFAKIYITNIKLLKHFVQKHLHIIIFMDFGCTGYTSQNHPWHQEQEHHFLNPSEIVFGRVKFHRKHGKYSLRLLVLRCTVRSLTNFVKKADYCAVQGALDVQYPQK